MRTNIIRSMMGSTKPAFAAMVLGLFGLSEVKAQTYLTEDFESAFTGAPAAPAGWTQNRNTLLGSSTPAPDGVDGPHDWVQNTFSGAAWSVPAFSSASNPAGAQSGSAAACFQDSFFGSGTATARGSRRLESPTIDLSTSVVPYVRFFMAYAEATTVLGFRVVASANNGATWTPIMVINGNGSGNNSWQRINVIIPAAYRTSTTKIGLEMNSGTWNNSNLFVDNLTVEEFTPTTNTTLGSGTWGTATNWSLGVVPTADHDVVIAAGHAVTENLTNMARCQNLAVNGTLSYGTTTAADVLHVMGDIIVNAGGTYNSFSGATGKRTYIGGSIVNNGTANFSVGAANTFHVGGTPATVGGTGAFVNGFISNGFYYNTGGVTYNTPLQVRNTLILGVGDVNPNGNLTVGSVVTTQTVARSMGSFSSAPLFGTGVTRSMTYQQGLDIAAPYTVTTLVAGEEIQNNAGTRIVGGTLTMNTYSNVQLNYPLTVGTGVAGTLALTRGIVINNSTNVLTLNNTTSAGPLGTAPSTATLSTTHGSYVTGALRINFPSSGTTARNFALGRGTAFNAIDGATSANVQKTVLLSAGTTPWAGQTITASIEAAPSGTFNAPLSLLMGGYGYRLNRNGGPDLSSTAIVQIGARNYTFGGGTNSDNLLGTQDQLYVGQSTTLTGGVWNARSISTGTGAFVDNTVYNVITATTAPGPIGPLGTNGEYFALASSVPSCEGTPAPGNTLASVTAACAGANFTLSLQNSTTGVGVSYAWEFDNGGGWTAFGTNAATQVVNQSVATSYRCTVTCTISGLSGTSTPVQVTMLSGVAFCGSYCNPTYTTGKTDGDLISNVAILGTTLANNTGTAQVNPAYTFFTGQPNLTCNLQAGTTYTLSVSIGTWGTQGVAVWIDYNDNGIFETPSERIGDRKSVV